jgi:REP element-mobilizing transposase RayT
MDKSLLEYNRKSFIEIGEIYFWTTTINNWHKLLLQDEYKDVIIESLQYLSDNNKIDVFAFVVMPNHIHLIWRTKELNGKETAQGSFLKYTAHAFKKLLKKEAPGSLLPYVVSANNKSYEFWQRDSLAIRLYSREVAMQKLKYIHNNPLAEHWSLVTDPSAYKYSSACYYEMDKKKFAFLKDLLQEF